MLEKYFKVAGDNMGLGININRDWKLVCLFFIAGIVAVSIVGYYLFFNLGISPDVVGLSPSEAGSQIDVKKLEKIIKDWDRRSQDFNISAKATLEIVDPSL